MNDKGYTVYVPPGHAHFVFPIPASHPDTRDDATKILDALAAPLRGAAPHITQLLDEGEDG